MPRITLNDPVVKALKPSAKRDYYSDSLLPALNLLIQPTGSKSWCIKTRVPGVAAPVKHTLKPDAETGKLLTCGEARKQARAFLTAIQNGERPDLDAKEDKARAAGGEYLIETVGADWMLWLKKNRDGNTVCNYRSPWTRSILPKFKGRRIDKIEPRELQALVNTIKTKTPSAARTCGMALKSLFRYAAEEAGLLDIDNLPIDKLRTPPTGKRTRTLSENEIAILWKACDRLDQRRATFFKLSLLTAVRREELLGMTMAQIDFEAAVWTVPGKNVKNIQKRTKHTAHTDMPDRLVPLSPMALDLLRALPAPREGETLFKGSTVGTTGQGKPSGKRLLDDAIAAECKAQGHADVEEFVLHDFRASVVTALAGHGVAPVVLEAILNHQSGHQKGGIIGALYNRHLYLEERRAALDLWADLIARKVGANVTPLRRKAG